MKLSKRVLLTQELTALSALVNQLSADETNPSHPLATAYVEDSSDPATADWAVHVTAVRERYSLLIDRLFEPDDALGGGEEE
jgi:putative heme degradation protein